MTPTQLQTLAITPALSLLPQRMDSPEARLTLIAIALQESELKHRRQVARYHDGRPVFGPARGLWQFEEGDETSRAGVYGVFHHPATRVYATALCEVLLYEPAVNVVHAAIEHHDVLAAGMARLLLWTVPRALPGRDDVDEGWRQYADDAWRPSARRPHTWPANWRTAQGAVA